MSSVTSKIYKLKNIKDNIVFFEIEHKIVPTSIHLSEVMGYRGVSRTPNCAHMMESDGNIFQSVNAYHRPIPLTIAHMCPIHHEKPGCNFSYGPPFPEGFKNRASRCRCYSKFASQYEFDRWNWVQYKKGLFEINDNARVFMRLARGHRG